jgi:hypothetical protein
VQGFERENLVITAPSPGTEGERSVVDVRTLERREKHREPIAFPALQESQLKVTGNRQYAPFLWFLLHVSMLMLMLITLKLGTW